MGEVDPFWIVIAGTAFAAVVFANGYRLFDQDIDRRMGLFHMIVAPIFVAMAWMVLRTNGKLP